MGQTKNKSSDAIHEYMHEHEHEHEHVKEHSHYHANTKSVLNRLSKAIGHLESVKRMVERGDDCSEVLVQLSAVRSAINNTGKVVLMDHLSHCIIDAVEENDYEKINEFYDAIKTFVK